LTGCGDSGNGVNGIGTFPVGVCIYPNGGILSGGFVIMSP